MPKYLQTALDDPSPGFSRVERAGRWSLVAIVAAGVLVTLPNLDGPWHAPPRLALLALGALYLLSYVYVGDAAERAQSRYGPAAYVILQLAIAAAMFAIPAAQDTFGMTWFVLMPLVGHAVFLLRPPGVVATCLAVVALVTGHAVWIGGPKLILEVGTGVGLAVVFVALFANVSRMEVLARTRSDGLREELEEAHARLAAYSIQASELAASRERNRMAREIHDTVGHHLTVVSVQLEAAEMVLERDPEDARRRIVRAKELAREGLAEVRRSVGTLRTSPLDGRPLEAAVRELAVGTDEPEARLRVLGEARELPENAAMTIYRAAQEGLTNARRHAQAKRVEVELDYRDMRSVRLRVADDGVGAPTSSDTEAAGKSAGFGLLGLRERVHLLGGRIATDARPGEGFTLDVEVPG